MYSVRSTYCRHHALNLCRTCREENLTDETLISSSGADEPSDEICTLHLTRTVVGAMLKAGYDSGMDRKSRFVGCA